MNVSELQVSATRFSSAWMSSFALRPLFFLHVRDRCAKETGSLSGGQARDFRANEKNGTTNTPADGFGGVEIFFGADALVPHLIVDLSTDLSTRSFGSSVPVPLISLWICFHAPSQSSRPFPFSPRSDSLSSSSAFRGTFRERQRDASYDNGGSREFRTTLGTPADFCEAVHS